MSILDTISVGIIGTILGFLLFIILTFGVHELASVNKRSIDN